MYIQCIYKVLVLTGIQPLPKSNYCIKSILSRSTTNQVAVYVKYAKTSAVPPKYYGAFGSLAHF